MKKEILRIKRVFIFLGDGCYTNTLLTSEEMGVKETVVNNCGKEGGNACSKFF